MKFLFYILLISAVLFSCTRKLSGTGVKSLEGIEDEEFFVDENGDTIYYVGVSMDTAPIKLDTIFLKEKTKED